MIRIIYPNEFTMTHNYYNLEFIMTRKLNLTVTSEIYCDNLSFLHEVTMIPAPPKFTMIRNL
jgi:hypothetical protein